MEVHFNLVLMQSFIVAMLRYWFIIKEESVKKYGKEKTHRFFLFLSIFLPIFMFIWGTVENVELDLFLFVNRCYGIDHRMFLIQKSPFEKPNPSYCQIDTFTDKGTYGIILEIIKRASCIFKVIVTGLLGCNFTEGILYYKIFSHIKRCVVCN